MKRKSTTFYCFSPPVMVATFMIEIALAVYVVWRYKMSRLTRLVTALLVSLATFQLAEYFVCGGLGMNGQMWSRIGYVAITLLPPLGLHVAQTIAKKPASRLTALAYGTSFLWIGLFTFSQQAFSGYHCGGNYVIFQLTPPLGGLYFVHYYLWLFITMYVATGFAKTASTRIRKALQAQVISYAAFILPTSLIRLVWPHTAQGMPSIMCGFAVIFAIALVWKVMPLEKHRIAEPQLKPSRPGS